MLSVPPLTLRWLDAIDDVARRTLGPDDRTGDALTEEIRALSALYTRDRGAIEGARAKHAARLRFFLPRDLPKLEGPLVELSARGLLPRSRTLRVVDLGAGYGTSSLGLARAAKRLGLADTLRVHAVDSDPRALDAFAAMAAHTRAGGLLADEAAPIELERTVGSIAVSDPSVLSRGADLALAGLVLNELFPHAQRGDAEGPLALEDDDARLERLERWLLAVTKTLAPGGCLVVIEPALREPSRVLQRLRDRLVERAIDVPFPCTHRAPCPLLTRERDWCHAELPLALPEPLAAHARAAGLRHEGLSYATLVVRNAEPPTARPAVDGTKRAAIVGGPMATKGKTELHLCHEGGLTRVDWMRRDGSPPPELHRGAQVKLDRALDGERARAGRDVRVSRGELGPTSTEPAHER